MDSSELTTSIKSAVRHLKQLGKQTRLFVINTSIGLNVGGSFQTNTFTENDLNNIDSVAETLMILVGDKLHISCFFLYLYKILQEKEILKLYSEYETESIDSSRLRHRLKLLPITIKNEIQGNELKPSRLIHFLRDLSSWILEAIKMARVSNLSVIQQLQNELDKYLQQVRDCTEQDKNYLKAIQDLQ